MREGEKDRGERGRRRENGEQRAPVRFAQLLVATRHRICRRTAV